MIVKTHIWKKHSKLLFQRNGSSSSTNNKGKTNKFLLLGKEKSKGKRLKIYQILYILFHPIVFFHFYKIFVCKI